MSDTSVAERLQEVLRRKSESIRWLQQELALNDVVGSSYASVYAYVHGTTEPRRDWIAAAAKILVVREEWLASGHGQMTVADQEIDKASQALEMEETQVLHSRISLVLAEYGLPREVEAALHGFLVRYYIDRDRGSYEKLENRLLQPESITESNIRELFESLFNPALEIRNLGFRQYAAAMFSQLAVVYLRHF